MSHSAIRSRRDFLRSTAFGVASAGVFAIPAFRKERAFGKEKSPNEKLNIAQIGIGGRGRGNLAGIRHENIVAFCDINSKTLEKTAEDFPGVKKFSDYRKMFDAMEKQIDAVLICTPDHTHAPASAMTMRLGKHCYCEKPLTHNVYEARVLAELAKKSKVATQMGTQIHAGDNYRRVVELVQSGAVGPIEDVHVWIGKGRGGGERPKDTPPVPKHIDWDSWIGPAPYRPYHPCYIPFNWRYWWEFGNGSLGDFGCHYMDLAFWALKLRHPTVVDAIGPKVHPETTSLEQTVKYEFPARGDMPATTLTWHHGEKRPAVLAENKLPAWGTGVLFVGKKGMLLANYGKRELYPKDKFEGFTPPPQTIPKSIGHHKEWIEAAKTGGPTTCNFDYSGALTESVLLGNVSYRIGKKLQWDAANLKAIGCPEADALLQRPYRKGWTL